MKNIKKLSIFISAVMTATVIMSATAFTTSGIAYAAETTEVTDTTDNAADAAADTDAIAAASYYSTTSVSFFIQVKGKEMDTAGNVSSQDKSYFTGSVGTTTLVENKPTSFNKTWTVAEGNADILDYVKALPNDTTAFKAVVDKYSGTDAYICSSDGKVVPWSKMNSKYYRLHWYVLKAESDCWHVDGVVVDRATDKEIEIIVPEEDAERAACVEYDVKSGTFTPGFMPTKANRPHSYWDGTNEDKIIDGFDDIWYTVLNEESFKSSNAVIPSELIDAAQAIAEVSGARLTDLDKKLQKEYGRIDSQAYKQEYIERTGSGKTLYVTPFITEMLASKYGVDKDQYIWLAMGDSHGSIEKVYVMDRDMAKIENMFDNE